jgi:glycosyltransferase involved in cell wall biosynthesis
MKGARSAPSVLLTTEGTYPYHRGGVSTWCDALTTRLSEVDFHLLAVTMHPYLTAKYVLPPNVREVVTVPLWGTEEPAEYGRHASFPDYLRRRWATSPAAIERELLPLYESMVRAIVTGTLPPRALGEILLKLHDQLEGLDYHRALTHRAVWEVFNIVTRDAWGARFPDEKPPSVDEVREAWRLLYRLMLPLSVAVPRVDLTHSAAAAFCGLPCIIAKLRWGTPFLLTEHGVYLREQYLNLGRSAKSLFVRWLLFRLMNAIVDVNYACADYVSPVCYYNTRWERWRQVEPSRIKVIYNGVDPVRFSPAKREPNLRPTVTAVGLIFPLKGQLDLIEAADIVRQQVPDVEFRIYGSASDEEYFRACQRRVKALDLGGTVTFAGTTTESWVVLQQADVVALPSISEAFPYALVEAMLTEAAVVATDVGGVREALGNTGLLVLPHDPLGLADAILCLLESPQQRERLGREARERALHWFTEQRFVDSYRAMYATLAARQHPAPDVEGMPAQFHDSLAPTA